MSLMQGLKQELMTTLRVQDVRLHRQDGRWRLEWQRPSAPAGLSLLTLLNDLPSLPPLTAALGQADDGQPVLLDLRSDPSPHLLVAGGPAAGKTTLLRAIALSLALSNPQAQLQMLLLELAGVRGPAARRGPALADLNDLPHLLAPAISDPSEAMEALRFLVSEMAYRREQNLTTPAIITLIDDVADLWPAGGEEAGQALSQLLQRGAAVGIHLVLSTSRPTAAVLGHTFKTLLPARVVGRVADAREARTASGRLHSQAEFLAGKGDFAAILGDKLVYFQGVFVSDHDLAAGLQHLHRHRKNVLVAGVLT
ncbi:MAG: FtsK/SpoIIIE domain-containing protein [Chloroflexota bacterium]